MVQLIMDTQLFQTFQAAGKSYPLVKATEQYFPVVSHYCYAVEDGLFF